MTFFLYPNIEDNLILVLKLIDNGMDITFSGANCKISSRKCFVLSAFDENGIYLIQARTMPAEEMAHVVRDNKVAYRIIAWDM